VNQRAEDVMGRRVILIESRKPLTEDEVRERAVRQAKAYAYTRRPTLWRRIKRWLWRIRR